MSREKCRKCRQHVVTDGKCKQKDGNSKKGSKRNARDEKKTCNRNADVFSGLIGTLDVVEERISELEDLSSKTSKNEIQRGKKKKMNKMKQNFQ